MIGDLSVVWEKASVQRADDEPAKQLVPESLDAIGATLPVLVDLDEQLEVGTLGELRRTAPPASLSTAPPLPITIPFWLSRSTTISSVCAATPTR